MKGQYTPKFNEAWVAKVSKEDFISAQAHLADMYDVDLSAEYDKIKARIDGNTPTTSSETGQSKRGGRGGGYAGSKGANTNRAAKGPIVSGKEQPGDADQTEVCPQDDTDKKEEGAAY